MKIKTEIRELSNAFTAAVECEVETTNPQDEKDMKDWFDKMRRYAAELTMKYKGK